jgi:hypothetical protein
MQTEGPLASVPYLKIVPLSSQLSDVPAGYPPEFPYIADGKPFEPNQRVYDIIKEESKENTALLSYSIPPQELANVLEALLRKTDWTPERERQ